MADGGMAEIGLRGRSTREISLPHLDPPVLKIIITSFNQGGGVLCEASAIGQRAYLPTYLSTGEEQSRSSGA